jgi:hypothetical protein
MKLTTAKQIIQTFETGKPAGTGSTGARTILSDGAGLSYGSHQSTDRSDSSDAIVDEYIKLSGLHASLLTTPIPSSGKSVQQHLHDDDTTQFRGTTGLPAWAQELLDRLGVASSDPVMADAQERVFERLYFGPAIDLATSLKLVEPLSHLLLMDTCIQSGFGGIATIRAAFPALPPSRGGAEQIWSKQYAEARFDWLARFSGKSSEHTALVRSTRYRPAAMLDLIDRDLWALPAGLLLKMPARGQAYDDKARRFTGTPSTVRIPG